MPISPFAGVRPTDPDLIDVDRLLNAFDNEKPDPFNPLERVQFGTSGHRGSSLNRTFNRDHIAAMSQAICVYRKSKGVTGPLFLGFDTHVLSVPAFECALEVFAANEVIVMIARGGDFTPTPVISHAILNFNKNRADALADGVVITPSHNPPEDGGFKYNPPHGGPAEKEITDFIQRRANTSLETGLADVKRVAYLTALKAPTTHHKDFAKDYVTDLSNIIDFDVIRNAGLKMAVDPMGGAGVHYWQPIADLYKIDLTVLNSRVDPTFRFMTRDWDGKIRMDPSSKFVMKSLVEIGSRFDIAFACDTDHDRHGIVTKSEGLMPPNHYLATCIAYLFTNRPEWSSNLKIGKTLVSSQIIDRVAKKIGRSVYEVPVGFKWFVEGLLTGQLGFAGEESAGATFLRKDASVWTTDKDAFVPSLLAAEMTAREEEDPAQIYAGLTRELGSPVYARIDSPATLEQKKRVVQLSGASPESKSLSNSELGGDPVIKVMTSASGNSAAIGGVKLETAQGWVAIRPSGTEDILKIYAESFRDQAHLDRLLSDAKKIVGV